MISKEQLEEALRENKNEVGKPKYYTNYNDLSVIMEAAAEYLKILEGDMVVVPREPTWQMLQDGLYAAAELYEGEDSEEYCPNTDELKILYEAMTYPDNIDYEKLHDKAREALRGE